MTKEELNQKQTEEVQAGSDYGKILPTDMMLQSTKEADVAMKADKSAARVGVTLPASFPAAGTQCMSD